MRKKLTVLERLLIKKDLQWNCTNASVCYGIEPKHRVAVELYQYISLQWNFPETSVCIVAVYSLYTLHCFYMSLLYIIVSLI